MKKYLLFLLLSATSLYAQSQLYPAKKIKDTRLHNFYQIDDSIYRSAQPSKKAFGELQQKGFKTILNLRRKKDDQKKAKGTQLLLKHLRFKTKALTQQDIIDALHIIQQSPKPLLIHCWHGSDRTGVITAAYRIVFQNYSKEEAIAEMRLAHFGYHQKWYPNLIVLLQNMDVQHIRKTLKL
ncbi:MAG: dual specificity protein phosphatase family protein [Flavobacteriaceae bacterium]|nr:dual specificity protein phosphatase family protein [Flavobacteriaceae bacterium]